MAVVNKKASSYAFKIFAYAFCILLTVLSIFPFVIMIVNATRMLKAAKAGHYAV